MAAIKSFEDLVVWQKAFLLVLEVYKATKRFPNDEKFSLVVQMRRAAVSVPSNIAEGQARHTTREFLLFLSHASGSLAELDTQLVLSVDLTYCTASEVRTCSGYVEEIQRMIAAMRRSLLRVVASH